MKIDFNKYIQSIKNFVKSIKLDWKLITIFILIGVIIFMTRGCSKKETIEVPVEIEVPVPVKEHSYDTIHVPIPDTVYYPVNSELRNMYLVKDSLEQQKMYLDAITERDYNETFEDSAQTINVYSKVRGELLAQSLNYKTKPSTVKVDTVIQYETKNLKTNKVYFLPEIGTNVIGENRLNKVVGRGSILFQNKKDNIISIGIDTQGNASAGYAIKF